MTISVGDRLPDVPLAIATPDGPQPTTSGEYFAGKRVALFAVPGAFTPTCSARHLPSYVEKAAELKAKGMEVSTLTEAETAKLRDKTKPVRDKFTEEFGQPSATEMMAELERVRSKKQ